MLPCSINTMHRHSSITVLLFLCLSFAQRGCGGAMAKSVSSSTGILPSYQQPPQTQNFNQQPPQIQYSNQQTTGMNGQSCICQSGNGQFQMFQQQPNFHQQQPNFQQQQPSFQWQQSNYQQQQPIIPQRPPSYAQGPPGFPLGPPSSQQQQPNYQQQPTQEQLNDCFQNIWPGEVRDCGNPSTPTLSFQQTNNHQQMQQFQTQPSFNFQNAQPGSNYQNNQQTGIRDGGYKGKK